MDRRIDLDQSVPQWLSWAREMQAIAQTSLHYVENDYQRQRFQRIRRDAGEHRVGEVDPAIEQEGHLEAPDAPADDGRRCGGRSARAPSVGTWSSSPTWTMGCGSPGPAIVPADV